jgi:hypothetical protein
VYIGLDVPVDFCPALAAQVGPLQNIFFLTIHYFNLFVPIALQATLHKQVIVFPFLGRDITNQTLPGWE